MNLKNDKSLDIALGNSRKTKTWEEKWEDEAGRWIPVTERLPEDKVDVLATVRYRDGSSGVNQGWYSVLNEQWYIGITGIHAPVTHWMPLPEPPKEDGDD